MSTFKALLSFAVIGLAGCAESGPELVEVSGVVTYKQLPVTQGKILFMPKDLADRSLRIATGTIGADGSYSIRALPERDGVPPGEYNVVVQSYTGSHLDGKVTYLVPKRFSEPATSKLAAEIPRGTGRIEKNFDLTD